jgi:hypothetical protein
MAVYYLCLHCAGLEWVIRLRYCRQSLTPVKLFVCCVVFLFISLARDVSVNCEKVLESGFKVNSYIGEFEYNGC